ncbi:MarR family winged helix-turn-helix transcriptional regulator [Herpetosiphon llansteffanensis]|uniref:MarR family winged helix-turn-helix transcriptional regulator n=1 Tax=Herpetosiphon llansteffanensis TaxID=2094568 RepID=UPI00196ADC38|nr:MarR family winged helix-turn-helix transcriptional regulator [Herpetosiphon llansteffanensis]
MAQHGLTPSSELLQALINELRQSYRVGPAFFRAAATRLGMTDIDIQVLDLLESTGDTTAGQLAQLLGLTTGTFTAILNRLEKTGLVRRERDPNDGRRVIVRRATDAHDQNGNSALFAALEQAWHDLVVHYDDNQKALLLEFLQRSNALVGDDSLREGSTVDEGVFSAPLAELKQAQLLFPSGGVQLSVRSGNLDGALYQARFVGPLPDVKLADGVLTIRYPRRLWVPDTEKRSAEVILSTAIAWSIGIQSAGSDVTADLDNLDLLDLDLNGAGSVFRIGLPAPTRVVPIRLRGGGSEFSVRRPAGVAARLQRKGWGSGVIFDDQPVSDGRIQSLNYDSAVVRYDLEASGNGSMFTITTD